MHISRTHTLALVVLTCVQMLQADELVERSVTLLRGDTQLAVETALTYGEELWLDASLLEFVSGFELSDEGLCSGDICIPFPEDAGTWEMERDGPDFVCVTAIARYLEQPVAVDTQHAVWSFAEVPTLRDATLGSAPDFELPDRDGNAVRLSDFRGKKVFLLSWASW